MKMAGRMPLGRVIEITVLSSSRSRTRRLLRVQLRLRSLLSGAGAFVACDANRKGGAVWRCRWLVLDPSVVCCEYRRKGHECREHYLS